MSDFDDVIVAPNGQLSEEQLGYLRQIIQELRRPNENYMVGRKLLRRYAGLNETVPMVCALGLVANIVAPESWERVKISAPGGYRWRHFASSASLSEEMDEKTGIYFNAIRPPHHSDLCGNYKGGPKSECTCIRIGAFNDMAGADSWPLIADHLETLLVAQTKGVVAHKELQPA